VDDTVLMILKLEARITDIIVELIDLSDTRLKG